MKTEVRLRRMTAVGVCALAASATGAIAQPMLLPPGPPAVSGRFGPRTQITAIPYFITTPGSYYLADTLTAAATGHGIAISSSDVTIDLAGHRLLGAGFAGSSGIDIDTAGYSNITVHDGHVVGWSGNGIGLLGPGATTNIRVYNVTKSPFTIMRQF